MARSKIDVESIGWSEQIGENVSISGSLTVTGSVEISNTIDLNGDGYLDLKKNGFINPQSVMINDPNSAFIGAHWIKVARRDTGEGTGRPMSGQTSHSIFLMTFAGREGGSDYATRNEFLVTVKFSPTNGGSPYFLTPGTHVTVEPLDSSDLDGWDPTSYIALTVEDNVYPSVELWIRSSETHKHLYCTYLGGNNNVRKADGSLDYVNPALELLTGQSPASSITSLGNEVYGRWAEKVFNKVGIGTTTPDYTLDVAGDIGVNQYIYHNGDGNTWINFTDNRIRFNAGGNNFIDCEDPGSAPHKVRINNGGNNIDFVIKDNSNNVYFTADASTSRIGIGTTSPSTELHVGGALTLNEKSSDPSDPAEGQSVLWMSDGTGTGDDGDILMKITAGGVTKTVTLVDFSAS